MKIEHIALITIMFMVGVLINHIAVTKLMLGLDAVWIYDISLIWVICVFYLTLTYPFSMKRKGAVKCH